MNQTPPPTPPPTPPSGTAALSPAAMSVALLQVLDLAPSSVRVLHRTGRIGLVQGRSFATLDEALAQLAEMETDAANSSPDEPEAFAAWVVWAFRRALEGRASFRRASADPELPALGVVPVGMPPMGGATTAGGVLVLALEDEAERLRLQSQQLESRLVSLLDASTDGIWEVELATQRWRASDRWHETSGFSREEVAALHERGQSLSLIHPDDRASYADAFAEAVRSGWEVVRVVRTRHRDGAWRHTRVRGVALGDRPGRPDRFIGVNHDVSAEYAARAALEATEQGHRRLLEMVPLGIQVLQRGALVFENVASRPFAAPALQVTDGRFGQLEEVERARLEGLVSLFEAQPDMPIESFEARLQTTGASGPLVEISVLGAVWGGAPAVVVFSRDVTEQRAAIERARQSERLATIGSLVAGVVHEINNPLAYVTGNLSFALDRLRSEGSAGAREAIDAVAEALDGALRIRGLVHDLRSFTRGEPGAHGPVDVHAVLEVALRMSQVELRHRARVVRKLAADLPRVDANEGRLAQVFLNLLVNAAHSMPEGERERHEVTLSTERVGNRVVVRIRDTGRGMSPEVRDRAFDPFFTTRGAGEGTGLGLPLSRRLVEEWGGSLTLESSEGAGTEVEVQIPVSGVPTAPEALPAVPQAAIGRLRILVVDDEPLVGRALARLLGRDHDVEYVDHAVVALATLTTRKFDLVLCDVMMPELDGRSLYTEVLHASPLQAARFVFMSGGSFSATAQQFLASIDQPQLEKPFEAARVRALVAELGARLGRLD